MTNVTNIGIRSRIGAVACTSVLAWAGLAQATNITVFDDFNVSVGHFNQPPNFSGSSTNVAAGSSAARDTAAGNMVEGAGGMRVTLVPTTAGSALRCRFLSGSGTIANNVSFTTSSGTDGWIGLYLKTDAANTGWTVSLWIETPSTPTPTTNNYATRKDVIADGQWHLYEWNLDDNTKGPDGWGDDTSGILGNAATVEDRSHTIDSVIFRHAAAPATSTIYMDFVALNPAGTVNDLLTGCGQVSSVGGVNGPLLAGATSVAVRGVNTTNAKKVTVYAGGTEIGSTTSGFADPMNVTVTPLVKGQRLQVTQSYELGAPAVLVEGCKPPADSGPAVGGGANPKVGVSFSIRQDLTNTGPIGAAGATGSGIIYWLKATGRSGFVPLDTDVLTPGKCWQTVARTRGPDETAPIDSVFLWNSTDNDGQLNGNFGTLDGIWLSVQDGDTGPYRIYIDELRNGSQLIQGWESGELQFSQPSASGFPTGQLLLDGPVADLNQRLLETTVADRGANSLRVSWQFNTPADVGLRLLSSGTAVSGNTGVPYPQVDLRLPLSVRVLVLPVGVAAPGPSPVFTVQPQSQTILQGLTATLHADAGTGLTYTWLLNGVQKASAVDMKDYTTPPMQLADSGTTVSVSVCDAANGSAHSNDAIITVSPCHEPPSDFDGDTDVDEEDFGTFQNCFDPTQVRPGCTCADLNHDNKVDSVDFGDPGNIQPGTFLACASRANVPTNCPH